NWVDMPDGIQADASLSIGGEITEMFSHITMRSFVQSNRKNDRQRINGDSLDNVIHARFRKARDCPCLASPDLAHLPSNRSLCSFPDHRLRHPAPALHDARGEREFQSC